MHRQDKTKNKKKDEKWGVKEGKKDEELLLFYVWMPKYNIII